MKLPSPLNPLTEVHRLIFFYITPSKARRRHFAKVGLVASAMLVCIMLTIASRINQVATVDDATRADAVVVLGCAVQQDGQPSPALRARIEEGVRVWRATGSTYLLLTGGVGKYPPAEAVAMATIAAREGVPGAAVIEDTTAHRTEDSAMVCAAMARRDGWKRVVLVSDPWHLLRARHLFVDADPSLDIRQSPALNSPAWTVGTSRAGYTFRECIALTVYEIERSTSDEHR